MIRKLRDKNGRVLFKKECRTDRELVQSAIKADIDMMSVDLSIIDLTDVDLTDVLSSKQLYVYKFYKCNFDRCSYSLRV